MITIIWRSNPNFQYLRGTITQPNYKLNMMANGLGVAEYFFAEYLAGHEGLGDGKRCKSAPKNR